MHLKQVAAATTLISALVLISGCSSAEYGIVALDREATAEDQLPDMVIDDRVNVGSVRKVAEQDRVAYFIGAMNDDQGYCAYAVDDDDENFTGGCGSGSDQVLTVAPGEGSNLHQMMLVMDSYDGDSLKRDNWAEVHPNILIR